LDPVTGDIYVANGLGGAGYGNVTIYSAGSNGNVAPIGTIGGSNTGLSSPSELRLDAGGNVYVPNAQYGTITVYGAGSVGNVAPLQTISGYNTGLLAPTALALGSSSTPATIYAANDITGSHAAINVFSPGSNGDVPPIRTIEGAKTKLATADGIALDSGGKIYVSNYYPGKITVYAASAEGNVKPIAVRKGLSNPEGIAIR
jgi:sugar lactone lactonase YvrE